jgi:hypothetical protein
MSWSFDLHSLHYFMLAIAHTHTQASEKGETVASSTATAGILLCMVLLTWLSKRYTAKRSQSENDRSASTTSSTLSASLMETDTPLAFDGDAFQEIKLKHNKCLMQSPTITKATVITFWILMLTRTAMQLIGVLGWWNRCVN